MNPRTNLRSLPRAGVASGLALLGFLVFTAPASGQQSAGEPPCRGEASRAFDFWLGNWRVRNAQGREVGRNHISAVSEGCALLERWTDARGTTGTSLNMYDASTGHWHQYWVGGDGGVLRLEGGLDGETMLMTGETPGDSGPVRQRVRWTLLPDGRVEQRWDQSSDAGENWTTAFLGYYERMAEAGSDDVKPE